MAEASVSKHSKTQARNTRGVRAWCFTWNNYTEEDIKYLIKLFENSKYLFGEEIGTEGTPHLQGMVRFPNAKPFERVRKLFKNNHVSPTENWNASLNYCSKDGRTFSNIPGKGTRNNRLLNKYNNVTWKNWQQDAINIVNEPRNDRIINWFHEPIGGVGKSFLCKYLYLKFDAIIADGKKDNVFNQVKNWLDNHNSQQDPILIVLDIPRYNQEYINYGVLEALKNGMIYSGKYEGGVCVFEPPHVIVFSNELPDTSKMSADRWNIKNIE